MKYVVTRIRAGGREITPWVLSNIKNSVVKGDLAHALQEYVHFPRVLEVAELNFKDIDYLDESELKDYGVK